MKLSRITLPLALFLIAQPTMGYELDSQKHAIKLIRETAKDLCENAPLSGGTEKVQLTGEAKAKLSGLLKKLAELGVDVSADYEKSSYVGVLQEDLADIVNNSTHCKIDIWNDLKDKLILPVDQKHKPQDSDTLNNQEKLNQDLIQHQLSNNDKLVKDQNPTDISIKKIKLQKYLGEKEPYVVAVVENKSSVSALNVRASFWKGNDDPIKLEDKIFRQYHINNLKIQSGKEHEFPIAPLSYYVSKISNESKPEDLIDFRVWSEPKLPFALQEKLCGEIEQGSCSFDTFTKGTFVEFEYDTIFGDSVKKVTSFSNVFLDGEVRKSQM